MCPLCEAKVRCTIGSIGRIRGSTARGTYAILGVVYKPTENKNRPEERTKLPSMGVMTGFLRRRFGILDVGGRSVLF